MNKNIISAYTEDQASKLTGLTVHQLRHWDRTGFFTPSFAAENRRTAFSRIYSFRDLLSLQVLKALRVDMGCTLQHLREVNESLSHLGDDRWSKTTLYVLNRKVVFDEEGQLKEPVSGQAVLQIPLRAVRKNMHSAVEAMSRRDNMDIGRIEKKRNVSHNAAVIAGTRIPVDTIKRFYEDGFSIQQIIEQYPALKSEDIEAAIRYSTEKSAA
ncbi:MAG: DUF433 domain-containing protein [Alphaproteobacteria bacterium]|nr:DUF433 domain-containing protein [Alphaproteobacteria bacterium]